MQIHLPLPSLCGSGREAQYKSLQNSKAVGSNPTFHSKFAPSPCTTEALWCTLGLSDVPTHNRIVCVRTMRNEFMTHRTLLLGRKGRWQCENFPWVVKRMEACVMMLRPVKATQCLMCYSYRRRGGAIYYGQAVKLESHNRL